MPPGDAGQLCKTEAAAPAVAPRPPPPPAAVPPPPPLTTTPGLLPKRGAWPPLAAPVACGPVGCAAEAAAAMSLRCSRSLSRWR